MGDFGKFGTFSKPSGLGESREEPTVLTPLKEPSTEPAIEEAAKKKISKPVKGKKAIDTYEERVKGKVFKYGGFQLGCIAKLQYLRFQHDPAPFIICLSSANVAYNCLRAVNLHYLTPKQQVDVVTKLLFLMNGFIQKGIPMQITYQMVKPLVGRVANRRYPPFRLYKTNAIRNYKVVPVNQWIAETKRTRTILEG